MIPTISSCSQFIHKESFLITTSITDTGSEISQEYLDRILIGTNCTSSFRDPGTTEHTEPIDTTPGGIQNRSKYQVELNIFEPTLKLQIIGCNRQTHQIHKQSHRKHRPSFFRVHRWNQRKASRFPETILRQNANVLSCRSTESYTLTHSISWQGQLQ